MSRPPARPSPPHAPPPPPLCTTSHHPVPVIDRGAFGAGRHRQAGRQTGRQDSRVSSVSALFHFSSLSHSNPRPTPSHPSPCIPPHTPTTRSRCFWNDIPAAFRVGRQRCNHQVSMASERVVWRLIQTKLLTTYMMSAPTSKVYFKTTAID